MQEVLKNFPYSANGLHTVNVIVGDRVDDIPADLIPGLQASGYIVDTDDQTVRINGKDIGDLTPIAALELTEEEAEDLSKPVKTDVKTDVKTAPKAAPAVKAEKAAPENK